mgnify:CR=1 FL=1
MNIYQTERYEIIDIRTGKRVGRVLADITEAHIKADELGGTDRAGWFGYAVRKARLNHLRVAA